jgi:hypothetical protein
MRQYELRLTEKGYAFMHVLWGHRFFFVATVFLTVVFIGIMVISPIRLVVPASSSDTDTIEAGLRAEEKIQSAELKIAACTVVRNDLPNLIEWIEFYRLQGFIKFWIFNDRSTDNVDLLEKLYDEKYPDAKYVEVFNHEYPGNQSPAYKKCQDMAIAGKFDWVAVMDTDEYWYSPVYGTVSNYILAEVTDPKIGNILFTHIRFGTSGQKDRFGYVLSLGQNGKAQLSNPKGIQLITREHMMRGPYEFMKEPAKAIDNLYPDCETPAKDGWRMCENGNHDHKSMWRPDAPTGHITPHHPDGIKEEYRGLSPSVDLLRGNHYYYRSVADAKKKSEDWGKPDPLQGVERVDAYWNSVMDVGILPFTNDLRKAIGFLMEPY